jgi:uncharacterized DUF497 family protein
MTRLFAASISRRRGCLPRSAALLQFLDIYPGFPYTSGVDFEFEFEWDEEKAASNFEKHEVDFDDAIHVFLDSRRLVREDRRIDYGEPRYQAIGAVSGTVLFVVYTLRGRIYRLISARNATAQERKDYYENR